MVMKLPRWTPLRALLLFGLVLAIGLLVPLPQGGREVSVLNNSLHAPAFALLAVLFYRTLIGLSWPPWRSAWVTCAVLVTVGVATEAAQYSVGRSFSLEDIAADSVGVAAGTLWAMAATRPAKRARRLLRAGAVGLLFLSVSPAPFHLVDTMRQYREFPVLGSFEHALERLRWHTCRAAMRRCNEHATDGDWSLQVDLRPGAFSGVGTGVLLGDWSGRGELIFDVELTEGPPLDWWLTIEDKQSRKTPDDRFERHWRLEPGRRQMIIPLADVQRGPAGRQLDLREIVLVQFFAVDLKEPRTLFLDNVRLR